MRRNRWLRQLTNFAMMALLAGSFAATALADGRKSDWGESVPLLKQNGSQLPGGCPIESPTGRFLFTARNPSGANIDIYVNERAGIGESFADGAILPPIISDPGANDFCPTPLPDAELYFVSNRFNDGACGATDMYRSVDNPATGYSEPVNLGCYPDGPNTQGTEFSPSVVTNRWGTFLFYSTDYPTGNQDIYVSHQQSDGTFGPGVRLGYPVNTEYDDKQPNVSPDGLEIVFASNRPNASGEQSAFDIFAARKRVAFLPWRKVTNLSETVPFDTEPDDETRPSLSWDGERLIYGSGGVWISERRDRRGRK